MKITFKRKNHYESDASVEKMSKQFQQVFQQEK